MADARGADFRLANRVFDEISASQFQGIGVKPHNRGVKIPSDAGYIKADTSISPRLRSISASSCNVTDIGEESAGQVAIVRHDRVHARFLSGGQRHNGITGAYNTARNAPGKAAKICIGRMTL